MIPTENGAIPRPTPLPTPAQRVYIGVDIAKNAHVAGFVSASLLIKHKRFTRCPTLVFSNSRADFERFVEAMKSYTDLDQCAVLMERTGHYHLALQQYLQEQNIEVYEVHASKRMSREKTDKRDAQSLANALYSQIALGVQVLEESQRIYRSLPPTETAAILRGLVRRRYEMERDMTQHKNKLTAISDTLFPELTEIIKDPNGATALRIRAEFPTPTAIAAADLKDLIASRGKGSLPSNKNMAKLQELATATIGTKHQGRIHSLVIEQRQLIDELRLLETHSVTLDTEIERIVAASREGKILTSIPGIGPMSAAEIIAAIGCIDNFERASRLRGYFGWSPVATQTGESRDDVKLGKGGRRPLKKAMYLIAWRAVKDDTEFRAIYERLIKTRCRYDERKKAYIGKNKVLGRIAGQIIGMIYAFLKRDHDLLAGLADGEEPPAPALYDRAIHQAHRLHRMQEGA